MDLDYTKFRLMVKEVASSVASKYPSYVNAEDTEGHLWIFLFERKNSVGKLVAEDPQWEPQIASTLRKEAFDHCAREKASAEGYSTDDIYRYSLPKLRKLLKEAFDYEDWQSFGQHGDGQPTAKALANTTGDLVAELSDVKIALSKMNEDTYNLLVWQFKYEYTLEQIGEEFDITANAANQRSMRALRGLQKALGRPDPDAEPRPSDRRVVRTNSSWRASLANQYEGG